MSGWSKSGKITPPVNAAVCRALETGYLSSWPFLENDYSHNIGTPPTRFPDLSLSRTFLLSVSLPLRLSFSRSYSLSLYLVLPLSLL